MSAEKMDPKSDFLLMVAAIFEENCLHNIEKANDIEKCLLLSLDYTLDKKLR